MPWKLKDQQLERTLNRIFKGTFSEELNKAIKNRQDSISFTYKGLSFTLRILGDEIEYVSSKDK